MRIRQSFPVVLVAAFFLAALCVHAQNQSAPDAGTSAARDLDSLHALLRSPQPITWVFTGDSVTAGDKWTHGVRDYTQLFCEHVRWDMQRGRDIVINTAVSGNKTDDILRDFDWRVAHLRPNIVSLMIGMNDSTRGPAGEAIFEANLQKLIEEIRANGAIPILQTTNWTLSDPHRTDLPAYNAIIKDVAVREHVILVENWQYWHQHRTLENLSQWLGNPIHPNGSGHAAIAKEMFLTLGIAAASPNSIPMGQGLR